MTKSLKIKSKWAFLNIPYDDPYKDLYLAFIAGISAFGLVPKTTLEVIEAQRRLDAIFELIQTCKYSLHDLSRVQRTRRNNGLVPRFNMPFELGLAIAWRKIQDDSKHICFVFEQRKGRIQGSLSDLDGTDIYIHDGRVDGIFRGLNNAFSRLKSETNIRQMQSMYQDLKNVSRKLKREKGANSLFEPSMFSRLVALGRNYALIHNPSLKLESPKT